MLCSVHPPSAGRKECPEGQRPVWGEADDDTPGLESLNCNHGEGLAVLQPVYYRHIYRDGCAKFKRFAVNVWGISDTGKTAEETAREGVQALDDFIREVGLPAALRDLGADKDIDLRRIADTCILSAGSYKQMTHEEIFEIFQECY